MISGALHHVEASDRLPDMTLGLVEVALEMRALWWPSHTGETTTRGEQAGKAMQRRQRMTTGAAIGTLLLIAGCADGEPADEQIQTGEATDAPGVGPGPDPADQGDTADGGQEMPGPEATGVFVAPDGSELGTVELRVSGDSTEVRVRVTELEPGFRGLHIHEFGVCEPDSADPEDPSNTGDSMSAGGHLNPDDSDHGDHVGDLSPLLVTEAGEAELTVVSDRFTVDDLRDGGGAAFMVHSEADNFAHIPERYGEPDEDTLDTGDAGDRVACAVIE